jgi:TonB family protein
MLPIRYNAVDPFTGRSGGSGKRPRLRGVWGKRWGFEALLEMRRPALMLILACHVTACAPPATPVSVDRVEDDASAAYLAQIQDAVRRRWLPPCLPATIPADADRANAAPRVPSGTVTVHFLVAKDGGLSHVRVLESSGHDSVDGAAVDAVRAIAPFAPVPDQVSGTGVTVRATLAFGESADACQALEVVRGEAVTLSAAEHGQARSLVGRWGPACDLIIKGVSEQGEVEAVDVSGNPIVGRYRAGSTMPGAVATVTWTWPAEVTRWERAWKDVSVIGGELVHAYYPDRALLFAQNRPYSKNAGVDDSSGDRLFLCAP